MEVRIARIEIPFCISCISVFGEDNRQVVVAIPVEAAGKEYSGVCIDLCSACAQREDINKVKSNLEYWIMESYCATMVS
jgi:hypothetical protein